MLTVIAFAGVLMNLLSPAGSFGLDPKPWMGVEPGAPRVVKEGDALRLENDAIAVTYRFSGGPETTLLQNRLTGETNRLLMPAFVLIGKTGLEIPLFGSSDQWTPAKTVKLAANPSASALSERHPGVAIQQDLSLAGRLAVRWRAILRKGANAIRQELRIMPIEKDWDLERVDMIALQRQSAAQAGSVLGSPVVSGDWFFGFEDPMSENSIETVGSANFPMVEIRCSLKRRIPFRKGQTVTYSSIIGVAPKGQMRRAFAYYVERERAHPYRPWLHYNSWYDIAFGGIFSESECLKRVDEVGDRLVKERGVKVDSFVFDDGWDEWKSPWDFHRGFPNGFSSIKTEAAKYGANPGVWLSPWGGYGTARENRLAWGKANGYEVDSQGYALSGPKYYPRFRQVCLDFVTKYGVNGFKFDGTGSPDKFTPGSEFDSDFAAAIALISDLRKARPDLFINVTTGTWPSPFWLRYADSTWRGAADHDFAGVGTKRQQWITYRDGWTFRGVVQKGPLYPVNSLMIHGLLLATHGEGVSDDPGNDFADEIWTYFGCGTDLQEMYITPSLLSNKNWDDIAEAAKWSRANSETLVDTHWIGGDPLKLEVYGWASWSPKKSILVLRNPSDKPQTILLDVGTALELPSSVKGAIIYAAKYGAPGTLPFPFPIGRRVPILLKPFQVLVLEGAVKPP